MGVSRLEVLRGNLTKMRSAIADIEDKATGEDRDLNDAESKQVDDLVRSAEELAVEVDKLAERDTRLRSVGEVLARLDDNEKIRARLNIGQGGAHVTSEPVQMSPGEYVSTYIRATLNHDQDALDTLTRDVATEQISETLGLVPTYIIGDLIKFVDANRYVVNSFRELPMPAGGKTFNRPRVTQRTLADIQTNEFDELTSQALAIEANAVTKKTHGTVLNISEQDIDWTDPALLQIAIEDMAESYAISTETAACVALESACTTGNGNVGHLSLTATSTVFMAAIAAGAANVYNTAKKLPDTLYAAPDRWAYLVGLTDLDGRPLFPHLSPVNALGTAGLNTFQMDTPMGLNLVVSPFFQHGFFAVGASQYCERYEQNKGLLQIPVPSTLSIVVAYRGYFATNVQSKALFSLEDLNVGGGSWSS